MCRAGTAAAVTTLTTSTTNSTTNEVTTTPNVYVGQKGVSLRTFTERNWHHTWHWRNRMDDPTQYTDSIAM